MFALCICYLPDSNLCLDLPLAYRSRYRNTVVTIPNKIDISHPYQFYQRQRNPQLSSRGDSQPAALAVTLSWIKSSIKIPATPLAALNLVKGHPLDPSRVTIFDRLIGFCLG